MENITINIMQYHRFLSEERNKCHSIYMNVQLTPDNLTNTTCFHLQSPITETDLILSQLKLTVDKTVFCCQVNTNIQQQPINNSYCTINLQI